MANGFNKEERVAFDQMLEGFNDSLVMSKMVRKYNTDAQSMERQSDIIWRPQPYINQTFSGMDQTGNFKDVTQLSVPATIGFQRSAPWQMDGKQLRDALQDNRLADGARQRLASDINLAITNVASLQGSLVVKRTAAASGYDDVALMDALFTEQGVPSDGMRYGALTPRDYNTMAGNLAQRQTVAGKTLTAYEKAQLGDVASFNTVKMEYPNRLTAAAGVTVTINGANQYYTPKAISTASTGESNNVDNRFQTIAITVTSGTVKVGDAFTIAGVNAVHHITKQDTGQLKTFRIAAIVTGGGGSGTVQITPPIISATGGTAAELQYQNVTATPANGAAITWLNTATSGMNPFWHESSLEILPGRLAFPADSGASVMRATTDSGIEVVMMKQFDINTGITKFRCDVLYGVVNLNTEMNGIILFNQV